MSVSVTMSLSMLDVGCFCHQGCETAPSKNAIFLDVHFYSILLLFLTGLTHCIQVDSSMVLCWTSPYVILGVLGLFCYFYSIFHGKSC